MSSSPIWHPFTQHAVFPDSVFIDRADGAYLFTKSGERIVDAISSWWVNIHGHNHPKIVAAVQAQAERLDQVIFAGFTHQPAEELAAKLIAITPADLTRVFFSDSGSTSVEVALENGVRLLRPQRPNAARRRCARARLSWRHLRRDVGRRARRV